MADKVQRSDPKLLASLLDRHLSSKCEWTADECEAIFRHQIHAPIQFELSGLEPGTASQLKKLASAKDLLLKSFQDLFEHPTPPVELLRLTKEFAKASINHPESGLPGDVAKVLYILAIAVARLRCHTRISNLDDDAIEQGITWAISQPWVDDPTRKLLTESLEDIKHTGGPA